MVAFRRRGRPTLKPAQVEPNVKIGPHPSTFCALSGQVASGGSSYTAACTRDGNDLSADHFYLLNKDCRRFTGKRARESLARIRSL